MLGIFDFKYSKYLKYLVGPGVSVGVSKCVRIKSPKFQVGFASRHVFPRAGVPGGQGRSWEGNCPDQVSEILIRFRLQTCFSRAEGQGVRVCPWG